MEFDFLFDGLDRLVLGILVLGGLLLLALIWVIARASAGSGLPRVRVTVQTEHARSSVPSRATRKLCGRWTPQAPTSGLGSSS